MLFGHVYHVCVCCLHLPSDSKARTQVEFPEMAPKRRRRASRRKAAPKKGRRVGGSGIVQGDFSVLDVVVSIFHRSLKKMAIVISHGEFVALSLYCCPPPGRKAKRRSSKKKAAPKRRRSRRRRRSKKGGDDDN